MRELIHMLGAMVLFAVSFVGCTNEPEEKNPTKSFLSLGQDTLWVSALGTAEPEAVAVYASDDNWTYSSDAEWLTVEQSLGMINDYMNVTVDENTGDATRETTVWVHLNELQAKLVVVQVADTRVEATRIVPADSIYVVQNKTTDLLSIPVVADGEYRVTSSVGWLSYEEQVVKDNQVYETFFVSQSYDKNPRYGVLTFESEQTSTSVRVMQWGSQVLFVDGTELKYAFMKNEPQTLTVMANGEWLPETEAEWVNLEVKPGVMTDTLVVTAVDNTLTEARTATVTISCGSEKAEITVSQEAMKEFGDVTEMTFPSDTKIAAKGAYASSEYTNNYAATKVLDGNSESYWYSDYMDDADPSLTIELDPKNYDQIDYVLYTPYAPYNSTSGQWGKVDIYTLDDKYNETKVGTYDFAMSRQPVCIYFENPIKGAIAIRFHVLTSYNYYADKYPERRYATAAEVDLYMRNKATDPLTVFTDWSLSELRPEVTIEQIEAIDVESYRSIAEQLYYGVYDGEFRICKFKAFPHPDRDAAIFRTNTYTLLDNVTGMYVAEAGDTIRVYVNDTHGVPTSLRIIDWVTCESASASTSNRSYVKIDGSYRYVYHTFPLKQGYNEIVSQCRGLMYIMCHTDDYKNIPEMTAHFINSEVNGYVELGKTDMSRAYELLRKGGNTEPHFDMMSHKALINFPKSMFYEGTFKKNSANTHRVEELLHLFDTVMYIQEDVQGHYKYKALGQQRVHRNRALFHGTYSSYYGASSSYRTYYNVGSMGKTIVDPTEQWKKNVTHYSNDVVGSIWGLAHELGHTNQTALFKWRGLTEVTNNLMCAITQWIFYGEGNTTMRFNDHFNRSMIDIATRVVWDFDQEGNWFERPLTHCESVNTPCYRNFSEGTDPTSQLMPFWQLYLYYHEVLGKSDFYRDFYELCRVKDVVQENYATANDYHSAATLEYMKSVSEAAGEDLSDFCNAWGLPGVNSANGVNKGVKVNHYGENFITTSAEQVAASVEFCKKYSKPKMNPLYIHDLNLDLYRNPQPVTAGTHSVDDNGNFTVSGWQNVVAWVLVDPNKVDVRTGEQGRVVAIKKWDDTKNGGFQYGLRESRYKPKAEDNFTDYTYTDATANKVGTSRALQETTTDYEYAKGLQLYAVDAYGTRYASQSNTK